MTNEPQMTDKHQFTGIGRINDTNIGKYATIGSIIMEINNVSEAMEFLNQLANNSIMAIGTMDGGQIGDRAKIGGIIIKQNLSEQETQEVFQRVNNNHDLKQRLFTVFSSGGLDEIKKIPGGGFIAALINDLLHPKPILEQKEK